MKTYRFLHRWHQTLGSIAALFVIVLVITGLLLNHTETFSLDQKYIGSSLLLDWYDINPPTAPVSYALEQQRVTLLGDTLYLNDQEIEQQAGQLLGALEHAGSILIAIPGELLILAPSGELLEKLGGVEGVPAGLQRIGLTADDQLAVQAAEGNYLADLDALSWDETTVPAADWAEPSSIPPDLQNTLLAHYRGKGLSLERVLLDIHSGRFLGSFGVFLIDAAAVLFLILAFTGLWMWSHRR